MKSGTKAHVLILALLVVIPFAQTFTVSAQSGRKITPRQPPPESPKPDAPVFAPDPNGDEYRIVYSYDHDASFTNQCNEAGAQGYRLFDALSFPAVAIFRRDKIQYEYLLLKTTSSLGFGDDEFGREYNPLAEKGFRVAAYFYLYENCSTNRRTHMETCDYHRLYLLERPKQAPSPQNYAIVYQKHSYHPHKIEDGMTEQLNNALSLGLYPTDILSREWGPNSSEPIIATVLVQSIDGKQGFSPDKYELRFINKGIRNIRQGINDLAQQGYRLAFTPVYCAVMFRVKDQAATPTSYVFLDWTKKNFEDEVAKLQEQGAIYWATLPHGGGEETGVIFELPPAGDPSTRKRREYKILTIGLHATTASSALRRVELDTTLTEAVKMLNELKKEGFEVRDLFPIWNASHPQVRILLERTR